MDGSFHVCLEQRGTEGCLIDMVDATNQTSTQLGKQETIWFDLVNKLVNVRMVGQSHLPRIPAKLQLDK